MTMPPRLFAIIEPALISVKFFFLTKADKIGYHHLLPLIGFGNSGSICRCFRDWMNGK